MGRVRTKRSGVRISLDAGFRVGKDLVHKSSLVFDRLLDCFMGSDQPKAIDNDKATC